MMFFSWLSKFFDNRSEKTGYVGMNKVEMGFNSKNGRYYAQIRNPSNHIELLTVEETLMDVKR
jgi:hypothetical protein